MLTCSGSLILITKSISPHTRNSWVSAHTVRWSKTVLDTQKYWTGFYAVDFRFQVAEFRSFIKPKLGILKLRTPDSKSNNFPDSGWLKTAGSLSFPSDLVRRVHARARRNKRGEKRASPVSRLQSPAWSFACLARFARQTKKNERLLVF